MSNDLQGTAREVAENHRSIWAAGINRRVTASSAIRRYYRRNVFVADAASWRVGGNARLWAGCLLDFLFVGKSNNMSQAYSKCSGKIRAGGARRINIKQGTMDAFERDPDQGTCWLRG